MDIKAIQTYYAGCWFRSRTEARWAVFFDALGIRWQYEPEGFETPAGRYLPDFWLPGENAWVEVKGAVPTETDLAKCRHVAAGHAAKGQQFIILIGDLPRTASFDDVVGPLGIQCVMWSHPPKHAAIARLFCGDHNFVAWPPDADPHRITAVAPSDRFGPDLIGFASECKMFWLPSNGDEDRLLLRELPEALTAGRSARFEHGQKP